MLAIKLGGKTPEEALELSLRAMATGELDTALGLMTGPQKQSWLDKIAAYGEQGARENFRQMLGPIELLHVDERDELPDGKVLLRASVRVQRNGQWVEDGVTHTYARDPDGLWRIWSF